jgi:hypothetical protein
MNLATAPEEAVGLDTERAAEGARRHNIEGGNQYAEEGRGLYKLVKAALEERNAGHLIFEHTAVGDAAPNGREAVFFGHVALANAMLQPVHLMHKVELGEERERVEFVCGARGIEELAG